MPNLNPSYTGQSPAALKIPTPDNTQLWLDIIEYPDNIIQPLGMFLVEKFPDGSFNLMRGDVVDSIWEEDVQSFDQYQHPDGTSMAGTVLDIMNHYGYRLITDYIPVVNALLAKRFAPVAVTAPVTNPSQLPAFPFSNVNDARQALAAGLGGLLSAQLGADGVPRILRKS